MDAKSGYPPFPVGHVFVHLIYRCEQYPALISWALKALETSDSVKIAQLAGYTQPIDPIDFNRTLKDICKELNIDMSNRIGCLVAFIREVAELYTASNQIDLTLKDIQAALNWIEAEQEGRFYPMHE